MCGIAGFMGSAAGFSPERLIDGLAHRGPDSRGTFHADLDGRAVTLVHTRLAIIDLTPTGHQPMSSPDGSLVLVFNGEIYNYPALRKELEACGHTFRGTSDTEVVLHLIMEKGDQAFRRLRGMFALALW